MIRAQRRVAGVALAVALLAGCSGGGDDATPTTTTRRSTTTSSSSTTSTSTSTSTTTTTTTTIPGPTGQRLRWTSCDGGFQCATLQVPLDHRNPRGEKLTIALSRRRARKPKERIGSLIMNPGGPGVSAIELIQSLPLPTELTDRFDIVGFDPRGVGRSSPLDCRTHLQAMYDADPTPADEAERQAYLDASKAFVDECAKKYPEVLPHLGTADVARDMDLVRAALGEEQVNYVGYSYGTSLGQQYARLFPKRVRTMVLDGVVDPAQTGLEAAAEQATGFTRALGAFAKSCDDHSCMDAPALDVIDEVIAKAEEAPIPARRADRRAGPGVVSLAIAQGLYTEELWPQLARAIDQADHGNAGGLVRLADQYLDRQPDGTYPNGFEVYFGTSCLDSAWPSDPKVVFDTAKVVGVANPRLGEALVNDYVRCAIWPAKPNPLTPIPSTITGLAPILVISTTGDPATPYESGVRVAERTPGAVLITNVGEGHTIFAKGKGCIDATVTRYLVDAVVPKGPITCR